MNDLAKKVKISQERLKSFEPEEGYYLAFSGGKDSCICKALCDMAGVKYDAHYRVTSVDPPELVRFIMAKHPDVSRDIPHWADGRPKTMWNLIKHKKSLPMRNRRFCCEHLKEDGGDGRRVITGVRWAESPKRAASAGPVLIMKGAPANATENGDFRETPRGGVILVNDNLETRRIVEQCVLRGKVTVNPIVEWTDEDVWEFIRAENVPVCSLYYEGLTRIGCIGCPIAARRWRVHEFARWPVYERNYKRAANFVLQHRRKTRSEDITLEDLWNSWMENPVTHGQISMEGFEFEGVEDEYYE